MNPSNAENGDSANSVTTCASAHTSDFHENNTRPDSTTSTVASMRISMLSRAWCNDTARFCVSVSYRAAAPHRARHLVQKETSQAAPITVALLLHTWGCLHSSTWSSSKMFDNQDRQLGDTNSKSANMTLSVSEFISVHGHSANK